jgi:hypothetical protein
LGDAERPTKRVCVGSSALRLAALIGALPPWAAGSKLALRTVATSVRSAGASKVTIALPA